MLKLLRAYPAWTLTALIALFFVFGVNIATLYTDWLWFGEVHYQSVFGKILSTRLLLFAVFGLTSFAIAYVNLRLAERFSPPVGIRMPGEGPGGGDVFIFDRDGRPRRASPDRTLNVLSGFRRILAAALLLGAFVFAFVAGLSASGQWESVLRFLHPTPFGVRDPLFGRDVAFYVFRLPFLGYLQSWLLVVLLLVGVAVAVIYFFQRGIDTAAGRPYVAPHVRAHLSALLALALLTQAWGYWLDRFGLLSVGGRIFTGPGYADVHARLPALNLLVLVAALAAAAVLVNIWRRTLALPVGALGLWLAASLLGGVVYPGIIQSTVVRPNEATREKPYIERAIAATRQAYNLESVAVSAFPASAGLTGADLSKNTATLRNIRLWDYEPLLETYPQQQGLRQYYTFPDVDVDRYRLGGQAGYRQVWLAAREVDPERLDPRAQTWQNLHLRYTHGFGVVMSPVNEISGEGLPTFFLKDVPTQSTVPGLSLNQPRIYYGQNASRGSYVVVGSQQAEFDYPAESGNQERENRYDGKGGVPLGPLAKWAFSWRFRDPTLLLTQNLRSNSRLLFARRVSDRIARVAPFLLRDGDPYPVVADGRVVWVLDTYTATNAYPYAAMTDVRDADGSWHSFNYIRNAVKATVDAYDGTVTLYAADERDPVLRTYRSIFPNLVRPLAEMPAELRAHWRYPEDLFSVQRRVLAEYHVRDPNVFYSRADSWAVAREVRDIEGRELDAMAPYYVIMRLPEAQDEEFLLLSPFTPRDRPNMIALLMARCDGEHYGQLLQYNFPAQSTVYGPEQIGARILQDSTIAPQLTLWNTQGSRVLLGNMLVVPVEKSLLYVQPLYLRAQGQGQGGVQSAQRTAIPELKRVIVAFGNRIAMEETLGAALSRLFNDASLAAETQPTDGTGGPGTPAPGRSAQGQTPGARTGAPAALIERASGEYDRAQAALRRGDFAAYGREIEALGKTLRTLRGERGGAAPQNNTPAGTP